MKLSPTQQNVVDSLRANGGKIVRYMGGFWSLPLADRPNHLPHYLRGVKFPWWCDIRTVHALEKKGVLQRANDFPEEFRDSRILIPQNEVTYES